MIAPHGSLRSGDGIGKRTFYLGRYNCVEQLGTGPLGDTFRAKIYGVAGFEKQFAVKRLHATLTADEPFVARFVPAASAFAALDHQRIARVHEVNAQGAHYYIVIDLVRGLDLRKILDLLRQRGEAISPDVAMLIAIEIAEGLEYAHSRTNVLPGGVLHLGLTAQSVMVTYDGEVKLVDVGLLAAMIKPGWSDDDMLTPTLAYLAPEELRGDAVDGRADLYSLGAVLHELISGSRLFLSDRAADLKASMVGGPPPPPAGDPRLQQIITSALNPNRDLRFRGAMEMRTALQAILGGRADRARAELSALIRRLAAPRERRTGAFAAVTLPPLPSETVTPISGAKPPPIPAHVWAPPVAKPPIGPTLSSTRTPNTLSGLGPDDAVLTPIELIELPGLPTDKSMSVVAEEDAASSPSAESGAQSVNGVTELTMTAEPENPDSAVNGSVAAVSSNAVAASTVATGEQSWTPPVVEPSTPSPEPVFAQPRAEEHAPVERPSSPVPGVKLPPRQPSNRTAVAIVGVLLLAGGVTIFTAITGGQGKPSVPTTPAIAPATPTEPTPAAPTEPTTTNTPSTAAPAPTEATPPTATTRHEAAPPPATGHEAVKPLVEATPPEVPPATKQMPSAAPPTAAPTSAAAPKATGPVAGPTVAATNAPIHTNVTATGGLEIVTDPAGANVFLDGEPQSATPAHLNVAPGKHRLVVAVEHHKLVKQEVNLSGHDSLQIALEKASLPPEVSGPAGLKVRCKSTPGELRIFVDGADSGLACPNDERISVKPGTHTIGLYSPRTDEMHEVEHDVVDGTNSTRVYTKF